ncbi:DUF3445 domain-containing protein [Bacillus shivajii]|uniref:heme-dependent oxidative N-demethylase family protein n=1 Tax=Bacillus shivajii TaxID=1983719 RepID=UPI001CFBF48E|nr:DUF3445 domain-containing protein [Bacillus shivajii]UCZ55159.1 DUF3445 domain-containing protein [Bacillus shivajii]
MTTIHHIHNFPYPFDERTNGYNYSNNTVPKNNKRVVAVTGQYKNEIQLKRTLINDHKARCFQALPHTTDAQLEVAQFIMNDLVENDPNNFVISQSESEWTFNNQLLNEKEQFKIITTENPLLTIGKHVQEDVIIMSERDGDIFLDAALLCFPSNWSLAFNLGMNFEDIHKPIPQFKKDHLEQKIKRFLLHLEPGMRWTRKNWSLMAGDKLDTPLETFHEWGKERSNVTTENVASFVHMRVEDQVLVRLPKTNTILFTIHTYLMPLKAFSQSKEKAKQFFEIVQTLPKDITDYKGISSYKKEVLHYLQECMTY